MNNRKDSWSTSESGQYILPFFSKTYRKFWNFLWHW